MRTVFWILIFALMVPAQSYAQEDDARAKENANDTGSAETEGGQEGDGAASPDVDPKTGMSVEEFLQRLSSVRNVLRRRDPFEDTEPEFVKKLRATREAQKKEQEQDKKDEPEEPQVVINPEDLPPLERFPTEQYEVLAVLMGGNSPRALIRIPNNGGNRIVQTNMALGDRGGLISGISADGLVVDEKIRNNFGTFDTERITIPIGQAQQGGDN